MATLQYTVFTSGTQTGEGDVLQENVVAIGAGSLSSSAITGTAPALMTVRIMCDTKAWVTWGTTPTAVAETGGRMVGAENPEYWQIPAGQKIAVIERV